jgi:hypothetical protein
MNTSIADNQFKENPDKSQRDVLRRALTHFERSVEITRDVRFQANLRLIKRQNQSSYMVSFLSLFVISISLLPNIIRYSPEKSQILLACSIVLSVFIIFTSLIDASQNYFHRGELLHRCARKTATVYHKLKLIDPDSNFVEARNSLQALQEEYREALDDCPINHENVDYLLLQTRKPHLFIVNGGEKIGKLGVFLRKIRAVILSYSWMIPHLMAIAIISYIVYIISV